MRQLLQRFDLGLYSVALSESVPGSYWGDSEAGLIANRLYARPDTPVHSVLHESCHFICMPETRRQDLDTNAGGDYQEENAVCYLQILLSDHLNGYGRERVFADMDSWGYSFRLGSSKAWFESDAEDALASLVDWKIVNPAQQLTWQKRVF